MKKVLLFLSFLIWSSVFSQITFQKTYGGANHDQGWDVLQLADSSYVIAGFTRSFGDTDGDCYLVKVNKYGELIWQKTFGDVETDFCWSFDKTYDGGFILAGSTVSNGAQASDYYFIKVDSMGNFEWQKHIINSNTGFLIDVFQSFDSCYYFLGNTTFDGFFYRDIQVLKTDASGNTIWLKTYGGEFDDIPQSFIQCSDSNILIVGAIQSSNESEPDVLLMKIDSLGNEMWSKSYGGYLLDIGENVTETFNKEYIISGSSRSFSAENVHKLYLIRTNSIGDTIWTKSFNDHVFDSGGSISQTVDSGYVISGSDDVGGFFPNLYLLKLDKNYNEEWNVLYTGSGYCAIPTNDEGFMVAGCINETGYGGHWDLYLIKTNNMGSTTGLFQNKINQGIKIFPNPTSSQIMIEANNLTGIEIIDFHGNKVFTVESRNKWEEKIDLSNYAKGIYLVKVITRNGISVKKIIKE